MTMPWNTAAEIAAGFARGPNREELERAITRALIHERDECARTAEAVITGTDNISVHEARGADKAAAAIRARYAGITS